ncbi:MAG: ABC transporter permease subunit [Verrucomicrobiales bacterium]|nr:ABC transporter permease subunit [Verrucomicrobiales bacterium]
MTFLPVVARELRVASRRSWTYWGRAASGGIAFLLCSWLALIENAIRAGANGLPLFFAIAVPAFGFSFLSGLLYAADSVSGEKRDGTLGLLFLTDLRGHDVTLGKLAGTSLGAIYGLVAMLPFLAVTLLLGGITGSDYARMSLVLLVTLLTSLATGLLASVVTVDVRRSVLLAFLLMVLVVFGGPVATMLIGWVLSHRGTTALMASWYEQSWLKDFSPAVGFSLSSGREYKTGSTRYWTSMGFTAGAGLLSLLLASWRLPRTWQKSDDSSSTTGVAGWLRRARFRDPDAFHRFRRSILDANPVTWLSARHWIRPWLPWIFLLAVAIIAAWVEVFQDGGWWDIEVCFALSAAIHIAFKLWVANEAPRQLLDDRRTGAMELLLSTPLVPAEIMEGLWRALRRQFLGPVVLVLAVDFLCLISSSTTHRDGGPPVLAILWSLRMFLLVADLWALGWAGFGAGMEGGSRTVTAALVFRVLVLPWILWILLATILGLSFSQTGGDDSLMWMMILSWFIIGLGNDFFWAIRSRTSLLSRFREIATQRPGDTRGWFRALRAR